jgi:hypothetical protein
MFPTWDIFRASLHYGSQNTQNAKELTVFMENANFYFHCINYCWLYLEVIECLFHVEVTLFTRSKQVGLVKTTICLGARYSVLMSVGYVVNMFV